MDKVKQILEMLRKHHFWILCAIAALVGLFVWYKSTSKLNEQFLADSSRRSIPRLTGLTNIESPHANDTWVNGIDKKTDEVRKEVKDVWDQLYKQQKEQVFIWPESYGKEFLDAVPQLEAEPPTLSQRLRERYQQVVRQEARKLADIVDSAPVDESGAVPDQQPADNGDLNAPEHRVVWTQLADIVSSFEWDQAPSPQMIKFMQEELWVYQALCNIVKAVNEGSRGPHDAPITAINEMLIAYPAADDAPGAPGQRILHVKAAAAGTPPTPGPDANRPRPNPVTRGHGDDSHAGAAPAEGGDAASADPDAQWKNYRYVKDTGEPMMAADLAAGSPEYNLMPFRMQLVINPRDLDRLLTDCRNSVLPIEVREVRINAGTAHQSTSSRGAASDDAGPAIGSAPTHTERVEVSGVVYLIKPPDLQKLGEPAPAEGTPAEGGAAAAAATPVPGGAAPAAGATPPEGTAPAGAPAPAAGGEATPVGTAPAAGAGTTPPAAGEAPAPGAPAGAGAGGPAPATPPAGGPMP